LCPDCFKNSRQIGSDYRDLPPTLAFTQPPAAHFFITRSIDFAEATDRAQEQTSDEICLGARDATSR
jgi:hypothetical protein